MMDIHAEKSFIKSQKTAPFLDRFAREISLDSGRFEACGQACGETQQCGFEACGQACGSCVRFGFRRAVSISYEVPIINIFDAVEKKSPTAHLTARQTARLTARLTTSSDADRTPPHASFAHTWMRAPGRAGVRAGRRAGALVCRRARANRLLAHFQKIKRMN